MKERRKMLKFRVRSPRIKEAENQDSNEPLATSTFNPGSVFNSFRRSLKGTKRKISNTIAQETGRFSVRRSSVPNEEVAFFSIGDDDTLR